MKAMVRASGGFVRSPKKHRVQSNRSESSSRLLLAVDQPVVDGEQPGCRNRVPPSTIDEQPTVLRYRQYLSR